MKQSILFVLLSLPIFIGIIPYDVAAQQKPYSIEWSKTYGGSRDDNANGIGRYKPILRTADGGYILAGVTNSRDGDIDISRRHNDMFQQDSFINEDIWIVKLSADGSVEWEQYYGGEGTDVVSDMRSTSDGGYILCGSTGSFKGDFPIDTTGIFHILARGGFPDGFVMKLDSLGRKEWVSRIGGSDNDGLSSVIVTSDGGYAAVGYSYSTDELWLGLSWTRNIGPWADAFIVKLASDGKKLWSRRYGGTHLDAFTSLIETSSNNFLICGGTNSEDGDINSLHYVDSINKTGRTEDVWLVELTSTGQLVREKCFGGSREEGSSIILKTINGQFVIVGSTRSRNGDVIGYHEEKNGLSYGEWDSWVFKIDSAWNIVWQNCIGGSQQDYINTLTPTRSGGYAFIGYTNSSDSDLTGIHKPLPEHNWDIWAGELSVDGKLLWHQCFGGTARDYGNGIVENDDGGFTLYASVGSMDGDIVGHHGGTHPHFSDIWVAKLEKAQKSVEASSDGTHFANPYPNPSGNQMNLYIHPTQPVQTVQYFNPLGQEFYPKYQLSGNLLTTDTRTLAKGMYIIRITYEDLTVQEVRKFVKVD